MSDTLELIERLEQVSVRKLRTHHALRQRYPSAMIAEAIELLLREEMISASASLDDPGAILTPAIQNVTLGTAADLSSPESYRRRSAYPRRE